MTLTAVTTLGVGLSMDAFAVSLGQGAASSQQERLRHALVLAVLFGLFQAGMPLIGWGLGETFHDTFRSIDHWIAFVLLAVLGFAMIRAGFMDADNAEPVRVAHGWKLCALAVATSIDAAAAGITLTLLGLPIWLACSIIGVITFSLTLTGALLGRAAGARLGSVAEFAGGAILIALGLKILIEHLYFA